LNNFHNNYFSELLLSSFFKEFLSRYFSDAPSMVVKYDLLLEGRTLKPQSLFQNKAVDLESNN
jgi:hypothetical protein